MVLDGGQCQSSVIGVDVLFVALFGVGIVALTFAGWGLRGLVSTTRHGRIGWWLAIAGAGLLTLFAIQAAVSMVMTEEVPENFVRFLLGFLLLIAASGLIVALTATDALGPTHDIGLSIFERHGWHSAWR
jgi:hypothetical protein